MFSRDTDKIQRTQTSNSVIGVEMQINGNIKCSGNLVLKGKVKGNIECDHINISSEGELKGNIRSLYSTIGGNFVGDVFADTLAIESTASIRGNLYYNNLKAQPGAKLDVQLIKGLEKKEKSSSSKKPKKV
ncbi:MAG: hypothetical protein CL572_03930 [Alphaproteobacteria bacterium]|jgi:cytoskeletal protein CcmA (bactofilin family)|nr:hypothetical protein [Alphaproteobacteria bacterium]|tara:strand:+ start:68 stop:460 length:393 start_codon:yes stop_codon:yes gene_type:complete